MNGMPIPSAIGTLTDNHALFFFFFFWSKKFVLAVKKKKFFPSAQDCLVALFFFCLASHTCYTHPNCATKDSHSM